MCSFVNSCILFIINQFYLLQPYFKEQRNGGIEKKIPLVDEGFDIRQSRVKNSRNIEQPAFLSVGHLRKYTTHVL